MNHNYIIILFLAIFLIQVEKIHCGYSPVEGTHDICYPVGRNGQTIDGSEIQKVSFSPGIIYVTTNIIEKGPNGTDKYTEGIGHFNYINPYGNYVSVRILKQGEMVNNHICNKIDPNEVNPFKRSWEFDPALTPPTGAIVDVELSIYWECIYSHSNGGIGCKHGDVSTNVKNV
ncbi:hypothetical protein C2G38_2229894 [Gigaspora rosea]|uniref:Chitin-binding type-4 domain-containing protein n=1 Tax=Gigaspora rosea TaxID=44941 RepID=A0A397TZ36_9GLOM|nr:hypothetical protein C2G38_2229894 [Gigaspora rosea]CAG8706442.1 3609_t:CDS:2 [Gigaspora rosea]